MIPSKKYIWFYHTPSQTKVHTQTVKVIQSKTDVREEHNNEEATWQENELRGKDTRSESFSGMFQSKQDQIRCTYTVRLCRAILFAESGRASNREHV